jgi:hypothetical protein
LTIIKGLSNPDLVLGRATYHLKKTSLLSQAQKEAMYMVNIVRGIELLASSTEPENIVTTWAYNNPPRDITAVLEVGFSTLDKSFQDEKP